MTQVDSLPRSDSSRLADGDRAYVDRFKITDYLLSRSHPDGRTKAEFFTRFGFRIERWQELAEALRAVGTGNPVIAVVESAHGLRYTVDGPMQAPDGRTPRVRTVWIVEPGGPGPRLITAHPL
jgi:hypothetical protein